MGQQSEQVWAPPQDTLIIDVNSRLSSKVKGYNLSFSVYVSFYNSRKNVATNSSFDDEILIAFGGGRIELSYLWNQFIICRESQSPHRGNVCELWLVSGVVSGATLVTSQWC